MTEENTQLLSAIKSLDLSIRELTEAVKTSPQRPAPSSSYAPPKASQSTSKPSEEIPQPSEIIADAGDVQVHFGKNNGVALSQLAERSLSWYAQEQEPRLNSRGEPFPPREIEVTLRNAARTLWHQKKGTLQGSAPKPAPTPPAGGAAGEGTADDFGEVPFSPCTH